MSSGRSKKIKRGFGIEGLQVYADNVNLLT
jgi:hypothetical protein